MRHITPRPEPRELGDWKSECAGRSPANYACMPGTVKDKVREALLTTQGGLCAYTGQRIAPKSGGLARDTMHIEHIEPQSINPARDTDFTNLVAAYPGEAYEHRLSDGVMTKKCPFGAHRRADWWDPANFIHPLRADCESAFVYKPDGTIHGATAAAKLTLENLGLDDPELTGWRAQVCAVWQAKARELSTSQLDEKIRTLYTPVGGRLDGFCFVIRDLLRRERRKRNH